MSHETGRKLEVGEPYIQGRTHWPETVDVNALSSGLEVRIFLRGPTADEIAAIRKGAASAALYARDGLLLLAFRFGDMPWMDASLDHLRTPESHRWQEPALAEGVRLLATVLLVDAATGILRAIRAITLSPFFSQRLVAELAAQLARGAGNDELKLQRLLATTPTDELVRRADLVEPMGE